MPDINWTLSLSDIFSYAGMVVILAWTIGRRLDRFEYTLKMHAETLITHTDRIDQHDEKFDHAMDRVGGLASELQRLIGRSEIHLDRLSSRRDLP